MDYSASELDKLIRKKMTELLKLNHEHKLLLASRNGTSDLDTETLNAKLYSLMAEVKCLKESEPEIMPKSDAFLYDWARHSLEEDIKQKEKILNNLDKMHEESKDKKSLIKIRHDIACERLTEKTLEDARSKNEELQCLHRKIARRLKRLSRRFPSLSEKSTKINTSTRDMDGNVLKKSFYRVLKEFVVEFQDPSLNNWEDPKPVFPDKTYCREHLKILCSANIIKKSSKGSYCLVTKNN